MVGLLAFIGLIAIVWFLLPRTALLIAAFIGSSAVSMTFARERLRAAFQRRRFDLDKYGPVIEAMAQELTERRSSRAEVSDWADLYANVVFLEQFGSCGREAPKRGFGAASRLAFPTRAFPLLLPPRLQPVSNLDHDRRVDAV